MMWEQNPDYFTYTSENQSVSPGSRSKVACESPVGGHWANWINFHTIPSSRVNTALRNPVYVVGFCLGCLIEEFLGESGD